MQAPYLSGFKSQSSEGLQCDNLDIQGTIPAWLSGDLVRIGPGKFEVGNDRYRHWFDGLGLLHKFSIRNGSVSYQNRFVQSDVYEQAIKQNRIVYSELGTDPCISTFRKFFSLFSRHTPNANVSVGKIGDCYIAMTEANPAIAFELSSLETQKKPVKYADKLAGILSSPHPHYSADGKIQYNYTIDMGKKATYTFYELPMVQPLVRKTIATITLDKYHYIHSFGMTENYFIFIKQPWSLKPVKVLFRKKPMIDLFEWHSKEGCEIILIDKRTQQIAHTFKTDSFFSFHHINAYEQGNQVIFDLPVYANPTLVENLSLSNIYRANWVGEGQHAHLRRFTLDCSTQKFWWHLLSPEIVDLPTINYAYNAQSYQYVYGQSVNSNTPNDFGNQLVKINVQKKQTLIWHLANHYPSEPIFIAAPNPKTEDDGIILSVVLDGNTNNAFLLVLDAVHFTEIARANVGQTLPFTFHGAFFN